MNNKQLEESNQEYVISLNKRIELLEQIIKKSYNALLMNERVTNNLFTKGNINWGSTSGIDFGLMNKTMMETSKVISEVQLFKIG